jgi:DNA-binding phage protein
MPRKITRRQVPASVPFRAADLLQSEAEIVAYIDEMLADGDDRVLPIALRTVRDALAALQRFRDAK